MTTAGIEEHDQRRTHCRMLGHEVPFAYCRRPGRGWPCHRILDCWFETFGVEDFLRRHYRPEEIREIVAPPQPKLSTLVELIEQARRSAAAAEETAGEPPATRQTANKTAPPAQEGSAKPEGSEPAGGVDAVDDLGAPG